MVAADRDRRPDCVDGFGPAASRHRGYLPGPDRAARALGALDGHAGDRPRRHAADPRHRCGARRSITARSNDRLRAILRPLLDAAQTLPAFVYLLPALALFNPTRFTAIVAAIIYAAPPVIRLVEAGIRTVPPPPSSRPRRQRAPPAASCSGRSSCRVARPRCCWRRTRASSWSWPWSSSAGSWAAAR